MPEKAEDLAGIGRLVEALRPWLGRIVIVGGWAHRLYRFHPRASIPLYSAIRTRDGDVALQGGRNLEGNIAEALKRAGFKEGLSGDHEPPVSQYSLGEVDQGFYAEFLTPLVGSGVKRDGSPDATVRLAGVTAQKLRHLDLLLLHPWQVRLDVDSSDELSGPIDVRLPSPVAFIAQKLLIRADRPVAKQAQDVLYVHDTLELFGEALGDLAIDWKERIAPSMPRSLRVKVPALIRDQYGAVNDSIRRAAKIPVGRILTPERMQAACNYGLQEIFGSSE